MRAKAELCIVCAVGMILATAAAFLYADYADQTRVSQVLDGPYSLTVQVAQGTRDSGDVMRSLKDIANTAHVSVLWREARVLSDGSSQTVWRGFIDHDTFPVDRLMLTDGCLPTKAGEYAETERTGETLQVGLMYSFSGSSHVRLEMADDDGTLPTTCVLRVVSTVPFESQDMRAAIATAFGVEPDQLDDQRVHEEVVAGGGIVLLALAGAGFCLLYLLLVASACVSQSKLVGIQKMLGWSRRTILAQICRPGIVAQISTGLLLDFAISAIKGPLPAAILRIILAAQAAMFLSMSAAGLVAASIAMRVPVAGSLKKGLSLRAPLTAGALLQAVVLLSIAAFCGVVSPSVEETLARWSSSGVWEKEGSAYVIASMANTDEFYSYVSTGDTSYLDKFSDLYDYLDTEYGALYTDCHDLGNSRCLDVNSNYLKALGLVDEAGEAIAVDDDSSAPLVILPSSMTEDQKSAALEEAKAYLGSCASAERSLMGRQDDTSDGTVELKTATYTGRISVFAFDGRTTDSDGGMVDNPVLIVFPRLGMPKFLKSGLMQTGVGAVVRLPIDQATADDLEEWLIQNGFDGERIKLAPFSSAIFEELAQMRSSSMTLALILVAILVICCAAGAVLAKLLVYARGREIAVGRLLGWSGFARYEREAKLVIGLFCLYCGVLVAMRAGAAAWAAALAAFLLWSLVCAACLSARERAAVADALKEA